MKDVDFSDYHEIGENYVNEAYLVQESVWCKLSSALVMAWYALLLYIFGSSMYQKSTYDELIYWAIVIPSAVLFLAHLLVLFRVELARKIVVAHCFVLVFAVPIGTLLAFIMYKNYKGRVFKRA